MVRKRDIKFSALSVLFVFIGGVRAQDLPSEKVQVYPGAECKAFFGSEYKPGWNLVRRNNTLFNPEGQGLWVTCPIAEYRSPFMLTAKVGLTHAGHALNCSLQTHDQFGGVRAVDDKQTDASGLKEFKLTATDARDHDSSYSLLCWLPPLSSIYSYQGPYATADDAIASDR